MMVSKSVYVIELLSEDCPDRFVYIDLAERMSRNEAKAIFDQVVYVGS